MAEFKFDEETRQEIITELVRQGMGFNATGIVVLAEQTAEKIVNGIEPLLAKKFEGKIILTEEELKKRIEASFELGKLHNAAENA